MFWRNRNVAVAGAAGLVGMHFIEALLSEDARVRAVIHHTPLPAHGDAVDETVEADLTSLSACRAAFRGADTVVLGAAFVVGAKVAVENPNAVVTENLILGARMLEAAALEKVSRVLLVGSTTTYPDVARPVSETEWDAPPAAVYQGIGNVKRFQETLAHFYHDKYGLPVAIVRPTPVYGEYDHFDPDKSHVIPALIRKAVEGMNPFEVWGTGNDVREFVHAADVARAGMLALEHATDCDPFNVGGGEKITTGELARLLLDLTGQEDILIEYHPDKPSTIPYRTVDSSKIRDRLGFAPEIRLRDGLRRTIDWYRSTQTAAD